MAENNLTGRPGLGVYFIGPFAFYGVSQRMPQFSSNAVARWFAAVAILVSLSAAHAQNVSIGKTWQKAAEDGLEQIWSSVERLPDGGARPEIAAIKKDLGAHREHQSVRRAQTSEAFDKAIAEFEEHHKNKELTKALSSAVEAYDLAPDRDAFLKDARVVALVKEADMAAADAEAGNRWFEALLLYRRLQLLFENQSSYKDHLKRVARKLRMLRLYAPDEYYNQADDYAKGQGEAPTKRWEGDQEDGWEKELRGIDQKMLLQALTQAADKHVESASYEKLFIGGIDALRNMLKLKAMRKTFDSMGDAEKVTAFDTKLKKLRDELTDNTGWLSYSQTKSKLSQLLQYNKSTINLPEAVIIYEFADGAMSQLDEFSAIIWPSERERFERTTKQSFSGVGIQITLADDELTVVSPLEGTPAHRAGIKAGDRIVTIDGKGTTGITLDQAVRAITGPEGTNVTLGVRSAGRDAIREFVLTRSKIKIYSVKGYQREPGGKWNYYIDPAAKIGYIRITQFGPDTAIEMDKAVQQMKSEGGISGLVLDLRFNPGGLLKAAVDVSNRFINEGTIVSGHAGVGGGDAWTAKADKKDTYGDFPVVVLINNGSASASEIVSGCLQDQNRGLIIGENSYGKGSVQQLFPLKQRGMFGPQNALAYIKVTTQYYKLPSGKIIHRRPGAKEWGVHPDIEVRMTDLQVEKLIKARMIVDVLRDPNEKVNPEDLVGHVDEQTRDVFNGEPLPTSASEILERGLDPQLETAVLLLRARLIDELGRG